MMNVSALLKRFVWVPWLLIALSLMTYAVAQLVIPSPPVQFIGAAIRPQVVRVGETATVTYHSFRSRSCVSTVNKGWVDSLGGVVLRLPQTTGGVGRLGEQRNSVSVPVPELPGVYCFRMVTHHDCNGGEDYDIAAPEACLEVVP